MNEVIASQHPTIIVSHVSALELREMIVMGILTMNQLGPSKIDVEH